MNKIIMDGNSQQDGDLPNKSQNERQINFFRLSTTTNHDKKE